MSLPGNRENARSGHRRRSNAGRKYTKMLKLAVRHGGVRLNDPVFAGLQLIFSRKLIYFSGIIMCGEAAGRPASEKRQYVQDMISKRPVDRLLQVFGQRFVPALREYNSFLEELDKYRPELDAVTRGEQLKSPEFQQLKSRGKEFSHYLVAVFREHYGVEHPIRTSLLV